MVAGLMARVGGEVELVEASWVGGSRRRGRGGRRGVRRGRRTRRAGARPGSRGRSAARVPAAAAISPDRSRMVGSRRVPAGACRSRPRRLARLALPPVTTAWSRSSRWWFRCCAVGQELVVLVDRRQRPRSTGGAMAWVGLTGRPSAVGGRLRRARPAPAGVGLAVGACGPRPRRRRADRADGSAAVEPGHDVGRGRWWRCSSSTSTRARVPAAVAVGPCGPRPRTPRGRAVNIPAARAWARAVAPGSAPGLRASTSR